MYTRALVATTLAYALTALAQPNHYVIELEELVDTAVAIPRKPERQDMRGFGPSWSGGQQLFWRTDGPGKDLETKMVLKINVPVSGVYDLELFYTQSPDAANYLVRIDSGDHHSVDGWAKDVRRYSTTLSQRKLTAGTHELSIVVYFKHPYSKGYVVGLDRLDLRLTSAESPDFMIGQASKQSAGDRQESKKILTGALEALNDQKSELEKQMEAVSEEMKKSGKGLVLTAASKTSGQTRYTFSGTHQHKYKSGDYWFGSTYELIVKARWSPTAREAHETISFQSNHQKSGQIAVTFDCSGDPFLAFPGAWPACKQTDFAIEADGYEAATWQKILKEKPLTFRGADPATAHAMMANSPSNNPAPPPPEPTPTPKQSEPSGARRTSPPTSTPVEFRLPTWRGRRVDLCLRWSADCGQPAADEFCRRNGFTRASVWKPDESADETLVIGDNKPCSDPRCTGFAIITCVK
jgi:hypothetical protein